MVRLYSLNYIPQSLKIGAAVSFWLFVNPRCFFTYIKKHWDFYYFFLE